MNQWEPGSNDRRKGVRFSIQAPAVTKIGTREIWAFTKDISTCGVYFRISADEETPAVGESLEFTIKIPLTMTLSRPSFITGRGRTVRTEGRTSDELGVAAEILEFQIQTESAHEHLDALAH